MACNYDRCNYNKKLRCWIGHNPKLVCPREDEEWIETVDRWALNREPGCVDWASIRGTQRVTDENLVELCNINQVFSYPDDILEYCAGKPMTLFVCKDLMRGRRIWRGLNMGFTRVQEEKRIKKQFPELII